MAKHFARLGPDKKVLNNTRILVSSANKAAQLTGTNPSEWVQFVNRNPTENDPAASDPAFDFVRMAGANSECNFGARELWLDWSGDEIIDLNIADDILVDPETQENLTDSEGSLLHKYQRVSPDDPGRIYRYSVDGELYRVNAPLGQYCSSGDIPGVSGRWMLTKEHTSGWGYIIYPTPSWTPYPINFIGYYEPEDKHYKNTSNDTNINEPSALNSGWTEVDEFGRFIPEPEYRIWEVWSGLNEDLYGSNEITFWSSTDGASNGDDMFYVSQNATNSWQPDTPGVWIGPYSTLADAVAAGGVTNEE